LMSFANDHMLSETRRVRSHLYKGPQKRKGDANNCELARERSEAGK
jgi:hypothetical protein